MLPSNGAPSVASMSLQQFMTHLGTNIEAAVPRTVLQLLNDSFCYAVEHLLSLDDDDALLRNPKVRNLRGEAEKYANKRPAGVASEPPPSANKRMRPS